MLTLSFRPARVFLTPRVVLANDNSSPAERAVAPSQAAGDHEVQAPEPVWAGPGTILPVSVRDGRYGLGTVSVERVWKSVENTTEDQDILLRMLIHYGLWMGFEGEVRVAQPGRPRRLPVLASLRGRLQYRIEVGRIGRRMQALTADGTILRDDRPAMTLDGLSIAFQAS